MRKLLSVSIIFAVAFIGYGCSGKVQTNKMPEKKIFHLPTTHKKIEVGISNEVLQDYEKTLQDFFKTKNPDINEESIYKVGMDRGHFNESH